MSQIHSQNHFVTINYLVKRDGDKMSDKNSNFLPEKVVEVMVQQILKKNQINPNEIKKNITDEQKQMLKDMVNDLKKQVEEFNNGEKTKKSNDD